MDQDQWSSVERLFDALRELPSADRAIQLAAIADEEVRREVASLLEHAGAGATVVQAVGAMAAQLQPEPVQRIGPYRIVRRLGQGGQGAVFEAVRDDGAFHRRVAIKMVKWEIDSETSRTQFRRERQILAGLEHPHIARLLDGGESEQGTPYLVMEFVDGKPLTEAAHDWPLRRKLKLFLEVAAAVSFAHRQLIVHRDLKPANILVTAEGEPKLLDFGIAKLMDSNATATALQALTPQYASPEQVRGDPITTACDVYSLGMVLYELLAGRLPYKVPTTHSPLEIHRAVCITEPARLNVSEDLDNILAMALRKEPERRYGSVEQFAQDVQRTLDSRPVLARPDTLRYRSIKFVRRNRLVVAAVFIAGLGLCLGAGVAVYQAGIARNQARIAQQRFADVRHLADSFLFDFDSEIASIPGALKARQMVVDTALKYLDILSHGARGDPTLERELAQAYDKVGAIQGNPGAVALGRLGDALESYRKSLAIYAPIAEAKPDWRVEMCLVRMHYGWALRAAGQIAQAIATDRSAAATLEEELRRKPGDMYLCRALSKAYGDLASLYLEDLNSAAAAEVAAKSEDYAKRGIPQLDPAHGAMIMTSRSLRNLELRTAQADLPGSLAAAAAIDMYRQRWLAGAPNDVNAVAYALDKETRLSQIYASPFSPSMGDPVHALEYARRADALLAALLRDPSNAEAQSEKAFQLRRYSYLHGLTNPVTGIREGREAIAILERQQREGSAANDFYADELANLQMLVANHWSRLSRPSEARPLIETSLATHRRLAEKNPGAIYYQAANLRSLIAAAACYRQLRDPAALDANRQAADLAIRLEPRRPGEVALQWLIGNAYLEFARWLIRTGDRPQARRWFEKDAAIWRDWKNPNPYIQLRQKQAAANLAR